MATFSGSVSVPVADDGFGPAEEAAAIVLDDGQELSVFSLFAPRGFHVDEMPFRSVYGRFRLRTTPLDERAEEWGGEELDALLVKECCDGRFVEKLIVEGSRPKALPLARLFGAGLDGGARGRWQLDVQELPYQCPSAWRPLSEEAKRLLELKELEALSEATEALNQGESKGEPVMSEAELEERRRLAEMILSGELPLTAVAS